VSSLCHGAIVWAEVPDPQGRNPKRRPAVIVTPTDEIEAEGDVRVVGISTKFEEAPPEVQVALPWDPRGAAKTQLRKPSWAVCTWVLTVPVASILECRGMVPPGQLLEIVQRLGGSSA
jgi:mRNA-degrading endonuclease toxin of MazEF toxin-antitoxin module